ncbi:hypothetical protein NPIL_214241 [Nephila pilipes]|uniref:Uncharacterized protein n=1 Tax=Nephila pilipes TaxID=299642 RepID=A0A8X6TGC2_NEPPI|nr:hypothetical protein NPIL_214241 [Nephila pilipes]
MFYKAVVLWEVPMFNALSEVRDSYILRVVFILGENMLVIFQKDLNLVSLFNWIWGKPSPLLPEGLREGPCLPAKGSTDPGLTSEEESFASRRTPVLWSGTSGSMVNSFPIFHLHHCEPYMSIPKGEKFRHSNQWPFHFLYFVMEIENYISKLNLFLMSYTFGGLS